LAKKAKPIKITSGSNRSISLYLSEIGKYEPLPPEREVELAIRIQKDDDLAMKELIESNLRFVVSVAKNLNLFLMLFGGFVSQYCKRLPSKLD
jgi:RNA polymerase primary sigma factor